MVVFYLLHFYFTPSSISVQIEKYVQCTVARKKTYFRLCAYSNEQQGEIRQWHVSNNSNSDKKELRGTTKDIKLLICCSIFSMI